MVNRLLIASFLFLVTCHAFAQTGTIKGVVLDARTYERLPFATVFINNSTLGTSADGRGEFILKNIPIGQHELVVTFVGHHHFQSKIVVEDSVIITITVRLAANELREVKIQSKRDKGWERQYEKFKKLFLGKTVQAVRCEILNPWVLDFKTDKQGIFHAEASDILHIENYHLGYRVFYQLKNFSVASDAFLINGNVRFKLMESSDTATLNQWARNRQDVYLGSSRHLFRSIVERRLEEEGFDLYRDNTVSGDIIRLSNFLSNVGKNISPYAIEDLTYDKSIPSEYKIPFPERLEVHYFYKTDEPKVYRNVTHPVSWLEVPDGTLIINSQGIVLNPSSMHVMGGMAEARVAESLPYDFQPEKTNRTPQQRIAILESKKPLNFLAYLLEKPYVHTDKSYYYPNETVWLRGYIKYSALVFRDSLSKVLMIDLVDKSNNVVAAKTFQVANGTAIGSLDVPPTVIGGDYTLRAYTRWMLNFDSTLVFVKPIKILEYTESGKEIGNYLLKDSANALTIEVEKDIFKTRELVTVEVAIKDFLENFSPANFSISVTDIKQVVPAENETNITTGYSIPSIQLPDSLPKKVEFPIQQGFDFKGRFVTKKEKPAEGIVTVLQEHTSQVFMITTEKDGRFAFNNLPLYDSSKLAVLAKTIKGKKGKVLMDSAEKFSPAVARVDPLKIEVYKAVNPSRHNSSSEILNARLLDEVVIRGTKETAKAKTSIGDADVVVTGDFLRESNSTDILLSLQSRVPGLRVVNGTILLGPPISFGAQRQSDVEPLVIIDGVPVNTDGSIESLATRISSISVQEIESIEVYKYSNGAGYGSRGANGVIVITTRKASDYPATNERARFDEIKVNGFSSSKKFYSPDYSNPGDFVRADYRSTIYWNPFVKTSENNLARVSFYTADLPTQYRIIVEGITQDGRVVHGEKLITIEERP